MDDDFRKRKPHPNFKNHFELEKKIMKLGKSGALNAYIVASGLQYHGGDSLFHIFLKVL